MNRENAKRYSLQLLITTTSIIFIMIFFGEITEFETKSHYLI